MECGTRFRAEMFIDATYEGDLMAAAGVSWFAGREANAAYGETLNGVQFRSRAPVPRAGRPVRRPRRPGERPARRASQRDPPGTQGDGDHRIQAYNFRICLTTTARTGSRSPSPRGYDADRYELLLRYIEAGIFDVLGNNQPMPNGKTDLNNNGAVSTDNIGRNYD